MIKKMTIKFLKVYGAGSVGANGIYAMQTATSFKHRHQPFLLHGGVDLSKHLGAEYSKVWLIEKEGIHYYVNTSQTSCGSPPKSEWESVAGISPGPKVLATSSIDETWMISQASVIPSLAARTSEGPAEVFDRVYPRKSRTFVSDVMAQGEALIGQTVTIKAWAEQWRDQKSQTFITLNDGSCLRGLQGVANKDELKSGGQEMVLDEIAKATKGCSVEVSGKVIKSPKPGQIIELSISDLLVVGTVNVTEYPMHAKSIKMDTLRGPQYCHLRIRTRTHRSIHIIRNTLAAATHEFFQGLGMKYVHTPCLTANDCEGAGETLTCTNLLTDSRADLPVVEGSETIDYSKDFFGKRVNLTVSGQLHVEAYTFGLGDVYTFGPTFRAEHSNTSRHLAEFWMIEPEIIFATLEDNMDLAEDYLKFCIAACLKRHPEEMEFLNNSAENKMPQFKEGVTMSRVEILRNLIHTPFKRVSYTDAIDVLESHFKEYKVVLLPDDWSTKSPKEQKKWKKSKRNCHIFENPVFWGVDLASEHEKYLTEKVYKGPIILYNYPKKIKSFYMKENDDPIERRTVQACDVLLPGIGEVIGGSAREDDYDKLLARIREKGIEEECMTWYLDLRKYGSVPHAGFGLGFERLVMLCTGIENIKDVIPYPRAYGECHY